MRNRERIVDAARELLVEHGPVLPLDEVARRAGVGNATLYRNFKDRGELMHHVVITVTDTITEHAERGSPPRKPARRPRSARCGRSCTPPQRSG